MNEELNTVIIDALERQETIISALKKVVEAFDKDSESSEGKDEKEDKSKDEEKRAK